MHHNYKKCRNNTFCIQQCCVGKDNIYSFLLFAIVTSNFFLKKCSLDKRKQKK